MLARGKISNLTFSSLVSETEFDSVASRVLDEYLGNARCRNLVSSKLNSRFRQSPLKLGPAVAGKSNVVHRGWDIDGEFLVLIGQAKMQDRMLTGV